MQALSSQLALALVDFFRRFPWTGWAGWIAFCIIALARTHPRRFGATFEAYLHAAQRFAAHGQVYDPQTLGDFLYLPAALLVLLPLSGLDPVWTAAITLLLYAAVFSGGAALLMHRLLPQGASGINVLALAGVLLLINIPAAWYNFKGVQSQIIMTGAMMAAAAAMMRTQWLWASFWLFVAVVFKPLALVMLLLCGALVPRMRIPLALALVVALALPYVFFDVAYLNEQYRAYGLKLWGIATAPPAEWIYQADFSTLLRALGIAFPGPVSVGIRLAAALATLWLAWRVHFRGPRRTLAPLGGAAPRAGGERSFALAVLTLSGCYITLFGPRNEFLSFVVLTPSIAALALLMLVRNTCDPRAWLLILAAVVLGFWWSLQFDAWMKPAVVSLIYILLASVMVVPQRWHDLVESNIPQHA